MEKKTLTKRLRVESHPLTAPKSSPNSLPEQARALANQGMFKEALLLWERAVRQGTGLVLHPATPLVWMINARQYPKAVRHLALHEAVVRYDHPALWSLVREVLAMVAITLDPETRQASPWNNPPWHQATTLIQALHAVEAGDDWTVETLLATIYDDSPFLPFRRILASLITQERDADRILALLEEIPDSSPFATLANMARIRAFAPQERPAALLELPTEERTTAARLCGAPAKWIKLLAKLERSISPDELVTLLLNHADHLPKSANRATCLNLLPDCLELRIPFEKRFGALEEWERDRLLALHHERQQAFTKAIGYWRKCIHLLENNQDDPFNRSKIALLHHHIARIEQKEAHPSTTLIMDHLERSLTYDADDPAVWLELLQIRSRLGRERSAFFRCAEQAAKRFPDHEEILTFALTATMERGSFKKAAGMARRIHRLNPGHHDILTHCLSAHLQHARRRIQEGSFSIARRELLRAERLRLEGSQPIGLLSAMLEFLAGDPERGEHILENGRQQASQKCVHAVKAFLEASSLRVPPLVLDSFRRDLIRCDALPPEQTELVSLAGIITHHHPSQPDSVTEVVTLLTGYFRAGATLEFHPDEARLICEALSLTQRYPLLALHGRMAERRWPHDPIFTAYRAKGECENQPWRLQTEDYQRLLTASQQLMEQDPASAAMIQALLAIPHNQRAVDPLRGVPLSPARIPKPLENKLLRELRSRLRHEIQPGVDDAVLRETRNRLLETLAPTEFGQRGPAVLGYLLDRAFKLKPQRQHASQPRSPRQLEMDLMSE
ncbi:MAG: hypothetical protein G8237_00050 [Magnetococcales bacterium]|nr:hypothetical protein [Magnetococcales bacterium]